MADENPETRASLLVRLKDGDDQLAWQEFAEIYQPLVWRIAIRKGLQPADAQDLAQEVLTRAAARLGDWEPDSNRGTLRGWLSTVARNLVVDFFRQQNRRPTPLSDSVLHRQVDEVAAAEKPDDWYAVEERQQIFRWASARAKALVSESTWQAFWMTAIENEAATIVAKKLQMSVGAVYIARSRMLTRIRELAARAIEQSGDWKNPVAGDQP